MPEMPEGWVEAICGAAAGDPSSSSRPRDEDGALAAAAVAEGWIGALTPALLAAAPQLRWLQVPNSGIDEVVFPELAASDVILTNMRDIHGDHVANHALAFFLSRSVATSRASCAFNKRASGCRTSTSSIRRR